MTKGSDSALSMSIYAQVLRIKTIQNPSSCQLKHVKARSLPHWHFLSHKCCEPRWSHVKPAGFSTLPGCHGFWGQYFGGFPLRGGGPPCPFCCRYRWPRNHGVRYETCIKQIQKRWRTSSKHEDARIYINIDKLLIWRSTWQDIDIDCIWFNLEIVWK